MTVYKPAKTLLLAVMAVNQVTFSTLAFGQDDTTQTEINAGIMSALCNSPVEAQACANMQTQQAQSETETIRAARAQHSVTALPLTAAEQAAATDAIKRQLRDPDSAEFRNFAAYHDVRSGDVICGEVNAKNAYGGYIGYSAFILKSDPSGQWSVEFDDENDLAHLVARTCRVDAAVAAP